jgi:hypothetical protein
MTVLTSLRSETSLWRLVQERYFFVALSVPPLQFTHQDEPARFVFFVSRLDVETLDIELLLYHIFKVRYTLVFLADVG